MKDIIITLPRTQDWKEYEKELEQARNGAIMNFKVSHFPKESGKGARCYLVYKDYIIGFMIIHGFSEKAFTCETTGKEWSGKFIERTGDFIRIKGMIPHKGFQGWRYHE